MINTHYLIDTRLRKITLGELWALTFTSTKVYFKCHFEAYEYLLTLHLMFYYSVLMTTWSYLLLHFLTFHNCREVSILLDWIFWGYFGFLSQAILCEVWKPTLPHFLPLIFTPVELCTCLGFYYFRFSWLHG